jgi:hypothetical protein
MKFRKLRIAFSVTCLIACVLLIVLWVRSYWWSDDLEQWRADGFTQIKTLRGEIEPQKTKRIQTVPLPAKR